jgi:hypothetical protein
MSALIASSTVSRCIASARASRVVTGATSEP